MWMDVKSTTPSWQAMTCVRHMRLRNRRRGTLVLSASAASPSAENLRHQNNSNSTPHDVDFITPGTRPAKRQRPKNETIDAVGWLQSWFLPIFLNDFSMILVSTCFNMFQHCRRWVNFQGSKDVKLTEPTKRPETRELSENAHDAPRCTCCISNLLTHLGLKPCLITMFILSTSSTARGGGGSFRIGNL